MKRATAIKLYEWRVQKLKRRLDKLKDTLKLIQDIPLGIPLNISFRGVDFINQKWKDHSCIGIAYFSTQASLAMVKVSLGVKLISSDVVYPIFSRPNDQPTKVLLKFYLINSFTIMPPSDLPLALGYEYKTKLLSDILSGKEV